MPRSTCASRSRPVPARVSSGTACRWASAVASCVPMACRYSSGGMARSGKYSPAFSPRTRSMTSRVPSLVEESSAKSGRATGTPPWSCTARRMANSSDALVANSPIGRSLRTMTSFGSSVVPASETSNVSLERPPGTTSSWVTRRSGESGNRRRRYACSSSAVTEHSVGEAEASGVCSSPRTICRNSSTRSRKRRSTSTSWRHCARVGRVVTARLLRDDVRRQAPQLDEALRSHGLAVGARRAAPRTRPRTPG